jgi:hypothetical protein
VGKRPAWWIAAVLCSAALTACSRTTTPPPAPADPPGRAADPADAQPPYFEDVTTASGIDFTYRNGEEAGHFSILETIGGGVGLIDYDGDGLLDVFLPGGGTFEGKTIRGLPCRLYRNLGHFRFRDVTAEVGLDRPPFYSHGCAVGDYDNDGWPDLLLTGYGGVALYHNEPDGKGGRRFVDVTRKAGLAGSTLWCSSAAWGDLNGDGLPDLYVARYLDWSFENNPRCPGYVPEVAVDVCPPHRFKALPHAVFFNNGNGTFRDASREVGLRADGKGLAVLIADLDEDGRPDVYVANDATGNFLYLNKGGRFEEAAASQGVAYNGRGLEQGSMGVDAADYDGSGHFSLFVTNFHGQAHALYRNLGRGQFYFASEAAGIAAVGTLYVGFGAGFIDFDRDGAEDLLYVNGHVTHRPPPPGQYRQRPFLLHNVRTPSGVRFEDVSARAGPFFRTPRVGRGAAFGDLDNDGRTDVVVSHTNEPAAVLRNALDNGNHWLGVALVGRPNRDAVGATATLEVGGKKLLRQVKGGGSYASSNDPRLVFGLGAERAVGRLSVRWPSGRTQTWDGLAVDRYHVLEEGEAAARAWPPRRP